MPNITTPEWARGYRDVWERYHANDSELFRDTAMVDIRRNDYHGYGMKSAVGVYLSGTFYTNFQLFQFAAERARAAAQLGRPGGLAAVVELKEFADKPVFLLDDSSWSRLKTVSFWLNTSLADAGEDTFSRVRREATERAARWEDAHKNGHILRAAQLRQEYSSMLPSYPTEGLHNVDSVNRDIIRLLRRKLGGT